MITPSKTQSGETKQESDPAKKVSSVVQVVSQAPISDKPQVKASQVNVVSGASSVVNVQNASPVFSSKVEVVAEAPSKQSIITKVEVVTKQPESPPIMSSKVEVFTGSNSNTPSPVLSSVVEVHSEQEPAVVIGNNIGEPEYDFLSRQPSEVVEETYKVINLKPSSKFHLKPRSTTDVKNKQNGATKRADGAHPTGLVTKLGGTVVKDGVTTVHETSVIGTYISGKYAQVLQSTSRIHNPQKGKISPSPTLRILKTAAPTLGKSGKHRQLEPTPAGSINEETALPVEGLFTSQNSIKSTRKPSAPGGSFKPQFKNRSRKQEPEENEATQETETQHKKKTLRNRQSTRNPK